MQQLDNQEIQEVIALIKNSADFLNAINWLPKGFLWAGKLPVFISGLLGTISSSMGILATLVTMWEIWIYSLLLKNAILFANSNVNSDRLLLVLHLKKKYIFDEIMLEIRITTGYWWWHWECWTMMGAVTLAPRGREGVQSDRMSYHLWYGNRRKGWVFFAVGSDLSISSHEWSEIGCDDVWSHCSEIKVHLKKTRP